jgi:hypothetical protein
MGVRSFHFDKVEDLAGVTIENANPGEMVKVLTRAMVTSDDPEFFVYIDALSSFYLNKAKILTNGVYQFLVLIHEDLSADLYVNDYSLVIEVRSKKDLKQGEAVMQQDIADIRRLRFPDIKIVETDKIVSCFKVGWRFGLFFDLGPRRPTGAIAAEKLDIEGMSFSLGTLYRYLSFYHVYRSLESGGEFEEMMRDGWFPFVEILSEEYKELTRTYQDKFNFEGRIGAIVDKFNDDRINKIVGRWWGKEAFSSKRALIEAGVSAYLQKTPEGTINCIKNLCTEIEGILRLVYQDAVEKKSDVKSADLIDHIIEKGRKKSGHEYSLLLSEPFLKYLKEVVFVKFNVAAGQVDLSRHTACHGVAPTTEYTRSRALQMILILDQIFFYL